MQAESNLRVYSFRIDASSSNIPTTYSSASTSLITTALGAIGHTHIKISNETDSRIAICNTDSDSGVPSSDPVTNPYQMYTPDNIIEWKDSLHIYSNIYIRSDTGSAITSGILVIEVWG
jgi:hypothetical protein